MLVTQGNGIKQKVFYDIDFLITGCGGGGLCMVIDAAKLSKETITMYGTCR